MVTGNAVSATGVFMTVGEALDVLASVDLSVAVRVGWDSSGGDSAAGAQDHPNNKRTNISDDSRCCCKDIGLIVGGFRYKNRKLPHVCPIYPTFQINFYTVIASSEAGESPPE